MSNKTPNKAKDKVSKFWVIVIPVLIIAIALTVVIGVRQYSLSRIDTFADCKDAGGEVSGSNCKINDKTFTDEAAQPSEDDTAKDQDDLSGDEYIGLTESEALEKAKSLDKIARVVERDGEALPVTMDLRPGRLNFTIEDGKVTKVDIEAPNMQLDQGNL